MVGRSQEGEELYRELQEARGTAWRVKYHPYSRWGEQVRERDKMVVTRVRPEVDGESCWTCSLRDLWSCQRVGWHLHARPLPPRWVLLSFTSYQWKRQKTESFSKFAIKKIEVGTGQHSVEYTHHPVPGLRFDHPVPPFRLGASGMMKQCYGCPTFNLLLSPCHSVSLCLYQWKWSPGRVDLLCRRNNEDGKNKMEPTAVFPVQQVAQTHQIFLNSLGFWFQTVTAESECFNKATHTVLLLVVSIIL